MTVYEFKTLMKALVSARGAGLLPQAEAEATAQAAQVALAARLAMRMQMDAPLVTCGFPEEADNEEDSAY